MLILDNLFGIHHASHNETSGRAPVISAEDVAAVPSSTHDEPGQRETVSRFSMDPTQSIHVMTSMFGPTDRIAGEETAPFMHRLQPM